MRVIAINLIRTFIRLPIDRGLRSKRVTALRRSCCATDRNSAGQRLIGLLDGDCLYSECENERPDGLSRSRKPMGPLAQIRGSQRPLFRKQWRVRNRPIWAQSGADRTSTIDRKRALAILSSWSARLLDARRQGAADLLDATVRLKVSRTVNRLREFSEPMILDRIRSGKLRVVGARYDLDDGRVDFFDEGPVRPRT